MKIIPTSNFDGYPDGKKKMRFRAGVESDVPSDYATVLKAKGLIEQAKKAKAKKEDTEYKPDRDDWR